MFKLFMNMHHFIFNLIYNLTPFFITELVKMLLLHKTTFYYIIASI